MKNMKNRDYPTTMNHITRLWVIQVIHVFHGFAVLALASACI